MSDKTIAKTPKPPYYAVIFTPLRTEGDRGYGRMAQRMVELAAQQPGFLGVESARTADGLGITVSYWTSEEAIGAWKAQADHKVAQETGQRVWYSDSQPSHKAIKARDSLWFSREFAHRLIKSIQNFRFGKCVPSSAA